MTACFRPGFARPSRVRDRLLLDRLPLVPGVSGKWPFGAEVPDPGALRVPPSGPPRPEPPGDGRGAGLMAGMISAGIDLISVGILRRVVAALTAIALLMLTGAVHAAPPVEPDQPDFVVLNRDVAPLSPRLRQAVLLDPKVAEATARARHHQETGDPPNWQRLAADARRADLVSKRREIESAMANFRSAGAAEALVEEQTKAAQLLARQDRRFVARCAMLMSARPMSAASHRVGWRRRACRGTDQGGAAAGTPGCASWQGAPC